MVLALILVWQVAAAVRAPDALAARSVEWAQFDVGIKLLSDGKLSVTETQVIDFEEGPFTAGSRNIPLGKVDGISNVLVSEIVGSQKLPYLEVDSFDREPGTYSVATTSSEMLINWGFSPTTDASRTFEITYLVEGAVRNYPNEDPPNQQIWWTAISSELTETAPVLESTTSITLTQPVDPAQVVVGTENLNIEPTTTDNQTWTWYATDLENGDDLTVRIQFPPLVNVATPSWQARDDEQRAQDEQNEQRSAVYNLAFLALGVLGAIVGGTALYGLWYTKGRDPQVGPVASFLAHPPGDLPPGAVGVLLDETADQRDVVATMVDLGNRGIIKLDESRSDGVLGLGASSDYEITLVQAPDALRPFEKTLLVSLFGSDLEAGEKVKMSDVGGRFQGSSETIKNQLYAEVVDRKFFDDEPHDVRKRYQSIGIGALVLAIVLGCVGISFFSTTAPLVWLPVIVLAILAVILIVISSRMPRKTHLGAEEAAKYRAFRTYLADIDKYENIDAKNDIFQKYLPYAIAFGLEEDYTRKFAQAGSPTPSWFDPDPTGELGRHHHGTPARRCWSGHHLGKQPVWWLRHMGWIGWLRWHGRRRRLQYARPSGYERFDREEPWQFEQQPLRDVDCCGGGLRRVTDFWRAAEVAPSAAAAALAAASAAEVALVAVVDPAVVAADSVSHQPDRIQILGISIDTMRRSEIERRIVTHLGHADGRLLHIATVNPEYVADRSSGS